MTEKSDFVHLHLHSEYSLLDGACRISQIAKEAKANGHTAVAITDHGAMYGVVKFYKACKAEGIKPIIGCEVYVAEGSRFDKNRESGGYNHLVLLVKNETGYRNLIFLVSKGFTEGFYSKPRIDIDLLSEHTEGLIALSACIAGKIPRLILSGAYDAAVKYARDMENMFGSGNFYLEIQNHGIPEQKEVLDGIEKISRETGIPMAATNDVHYLKKSDAEKQAVLLCIQTNNVIADGRPIGFETDEYYYKSTEEMTQLFSSYEGAVENTSKIADKCNFDFDFSKTFLPKYVCPDGKSGAEYLRELTAQGLERRHKSSLISFDGAFSKEDYVKRAEYELSVIEQMGYSEYFLIVRDFVDHAKRKNITVGPGRGSGAGSLVAFLIGITDIDSLSYDLSFESFLNIDRVSMPDFDIDFADNRREEVIDYVKQKYGDDHVAQIITFGTMSARAVVRDVGRALGISYSTVDKVAKLIPREHNVTLASALRTKEIRELYDNDSEIRNLMDTSMSLEGMPRHASTHAAGVVITDKPVSSYVPLAESSGNVLTQFDMDTVAELGLLKFDFLGIRYLTVIAEAEAQIKKSDPQFDIEKIPYDDEKTFRLICKGNTEGVFQLNSSGMRAKLIQIRPENFDDIIAAIALYRPGPMKAGAIDAYAENKKDRSKIKYPTPLLASVLDQTYGCLVYQEQVAKIFRDLGGYSFNRADNVRRAVKKKKADVIESERPRFIEGASKKGIKREDAEKIFADIEGFAEYAFNKSHATAYAVVAYRTAYLKAHYKKEYYAALITAEMSNQAKVGEYIAECRKSGIEVLPPDINSSALGFTAEKDSIRFGLLAILNVGRPLAEFIVKERVRGGVYKSIDDFIERAAFSDLNKRQYEMLVKAGALDTFGIKRSCLIALSDRVSEQKSALGNKMEGQLDIMSMLDGEEVPSSLKIPDFPELDLTQKLRYEKESMGIYLSGSLLSKYSDHLSKLRCTPISSIKRSLLDDSGEIEGDIKDGSKVTVAGIITARSNKNTRSGDPMAFVTLEDRTGEIDFLVFPKLFVKCAYMLTRDSAVFVTGTVSVKDDDVSVLAASVTPLEENAASVKTDEKQKAPREKTLYIKLDDVETPTYRNAHVLIKQHPGDVSVVFYSTERKAYVREKGLSCKPSEDLLSALSLILGKDSVVLR